MPNVFTTRISHVTFTLSPLSSESMAQIGEVVLRAKKERIFQSLNSQDAPAKPLVDKYARRKILRNRAPVRDWFFRGVTRTALRVKSANENQVTLGPISTQADQILTAQRRMEEMWSDSPHDTAVLHSVVRATLQQQQVVRVVRSAARKTA